MACVWTFGKKERKWKLQGLKCVDKWSRRKKGKEQEKEKGGDGQGKLSMGTSL